MNRLGIAVISVVAATSILAGCGRKEEPQVSFKADVMPILQRHCMECHDAVGSGTAASGFAVVSYNGVMQGTQYGPVVLPGDPDSSVLLQLVEGRADPSLTMPHGDREKLYAAEKDTLRTWVAQGAKDN